MGRIINNRHLVSLLKVEGVSVFAHRLYMCKQTLSITSLNSALTYFCQLSFTINQNISACFISTGQTQGTIIVLILCKCPMTTTVNSWSPTTDLWRIRRWPWWRSRGGRHGEHGEHLLRSYVCGQLPSGRPTPIWPAGKPHTYRRGSEGSKR